MTTQRGRRLADRNFGQQALDRRTVLKGMVGTGLGVAFASSMADLLAAAPTGAAATVRGSAAEAAQTYASATNPFTSSWAVPLPGSNVVAPGGAALAANLAAQVNTPQNPYDIGINQMPYFVIPANQGMVGISGSVGNTGGQIPIPPAAQSVVAQSPDSPLVIFQPSSDTVWEIWEAEYSVSGGWTAGDAGVIAGCAGSIGTFASYYGMSASGIAYSGTMITLADLARCQAGGEIGHVLALQTAQEQMPFLPPAVRNDGGGQSSVPGAPPEGTWFQMPKSTPMPAGLPPVAQYVFKALQDYGCVVVDHSGGVYFQFEGSSSWASNGMGGTDPLTASLGSAATYDALAGIDLGAMLPIVPPPLGASPGSAPERCRFTLTPGNGSIAVVITPQPSATPIRQYIVSYRISGGNPFTTVTPYLSGSSTNTTISGLKTGLSYDVQISAVNDVTFSTPSRATCVVGAAAPSVHSLATVAQTSAITKYNYVKSATQSLPRASAGGVLVLMSMVSTGGGEPTPELQAVTGGPSGIKWTKVAASTFSSPTYEVGMWVGTGYQSSSTPVSVTATYAKQAWPRLVLMECSGINPTAPVDTAAANDTSTQGFNTTGIGATVTPSKAGNLVVACCFAEANGVNATAPSWAQNSGSGSMTAWQWQKAATASPQTAEWTVEYNGGAASVLSLNAG